MKNSQYYVGYSKDLKLRINEHRLGRVKTTSKHLPFKLSFYAAFFNKEKATSFEKYLKSSSGFAFRNKRLL